MTSIEEVKERYIQGNVTIKALAEESGIAFRELWQRGREEHWTTLRAVYRKEHRAERVAAQCEKKIPWNEVHMRFVSGSMGYKELAEAYGTTYRKVWERASSEKWKEERERHRAARAQACMDGADDASVQIYYTEPQIVNSEDTRKPVNVDYPYEKIMYDFVTGNKSYAQLEREYGVSICALKNLGARHNWRGMRENYRRHRYATFLNADLAEARANAKEINQTIAQLCREMNDAAKRLRKKGATYAELNEAMDVAAKALKVNANAAGQLSAEEIAKIESVLRKIETQAEIERKKKEPQVVKYVLSPELDELAR